MLEQRDIWETRTSTKEFKIEKIEKSTINHQNGFVRSTKSWFNFAYWFFVYFRFKGNDKMEVEPQAVGLKREMGLMAAINVIIGVMIGSGIFISPQAALQYSGSIGACLLVWVACGVISLLGALCFAELGTVVPRSGAEYAYLIEAFAKTDKFWGPLPSFVCAWVYVSWAKISTTTKHWWRLFLLRWWCWDLQRLLW